ncbi:hypothetical protein BKA93DRAFT_803447 [Sparassis latifolia]
MTACSSIRQPPSFWKYPYLSLVHLLTPYTPAQHAGFERTGWFLPRGRATSGCIQRSHKLSGTVSPTRPSRCYRGFTRN